MSILPIKISTFLFVLIFSLPLEMQQTELGFVFCPNVCQIASNLLVKHFSLIEFSSADRSSFQSPSFNCLFISKTANRKASDSLLSDEIASFSGNQSIAISHYPRPLRCIMRLLLGVVSSSPGTSVSSNAVLECYAISFP